MSRKVLISGGAGFIGCHVARKLLERGDEVLVFDNLHPQVHTQFGLPQDMPKGVVFVPGDVTVAENWGTLFRFFRPDVVIHLAAETGTGQSLTESHRHASVNVAGTARLIDALTAIRHVPEQFVLTSSRAVYGDGAWRDTAGTVFYPPARSRQALELQQWNLSGPTGLPAEAMPSVAGQTHPNPISVYGATKLTQEHMLAAWCGAFGSGLSILRLQNVYGPGQAPGNPYTGVLTLFARLAREQKVLDIYEDGKIVRDFVHVEDVAQAIVQAVARPTRNVRMFDIGSGSPTTIDAVARELARRYGAPAPVVSGKFRDGDVRAASCSIESARGALDYQPRWTLEAGLASLKEWLEGVLDTRSAPRT
ncbi:NAD-dependent epimerase/dehydratase family protein [Stigmatella sp. ncwal1]|uniref:NAD-dependent epimerase/dehydratase family protein n=1 Tax=Stigmatella ashevillensis TaxID=2995309 RepID=A0ABT5D627_9BACT|nr:NAD-dependent epimerase/dehydratase family protein [Stigmatella ashevillena]MDC0708318.1 NAD-dependent epimerase/dehydratase family protein [Stigmatella ashevillena]